MASEAIGLLTRLNLALAGGVVLALLLRLPARQAFGARIAYALWTIPLLAALACFLPARTEVIRLAVAPPLARANLAPASMPDLSFAPRLLLALWICGVAASLIVLIVRQTRYARGLGRLSDRPELGRGVLGAQTNEHGPAVLGVLRPVIVTPANFDARFSADERGIVLAHERAHMAHGDPIINAISAALQCVSWFNPLVHVGAHLLRVDQELACDAAVVTSANARLYAEAILKTQLAAATLPFGCAWPSHSLAALKERIAMLKTALPTPAQRIIGVSAVGLASFTACAVAWAAQPAHVLASGPTSPAAAAHAPMAPALPASSAQPALPALPASPALPAPPALETAPAPRTDAQSNDQLAPDPADVDNALSGEARGAQAPVDADMANSDAREFARHPLTPEVRARVRAALERARVSQRAAIAAAQAGVRAAELAQTQVRVAQERAAVWNSPEMRSEIAALSAAASRMALVENNLAERQALRAEIEAHAQRIREIAQHLRSDQN